MRAILLAALLLSAAMAGCADRADAISARDGLGPARDAARAHGDDPVLVGIASVEPFKHLSDDDYEVWVHLDKNPGDGRAPGWFYTFRSGDRFIGIVYAAGLGVIAEGYEIQDEDERGDASMGYDMTPITDWVLDSTDVARVLAGTDGWPAASDGTTVFWDLHQAEGGPVWYVEWENETTGMEASVDARTGNVTQIDSWDTFEGSFSCAMVMGGGGQVSPLNSPSQEIDVEEGGNLDYSYRWTMQLGEATMTLSGPGGFEQEETLSGTGTTAGRVDGLAAGTYTLTAQTQIGLGQVSSMTMASCA